MTRIEHVALWTDDLERLRAWYERWLGGRAGERYVNERTGFSSYFLEFDGGARLELMTLRGSAEEPPGLPETPSRGALRGQALRAHLAFAFGSAERVDALTEELRAAGVPVLSEPRTTGDGYYESVVSDPDGNRVELTI